MEISVDNSYIDVGHIGIFYRLIISIFRQPERKCNQFEVSKREERITKANRNYRICRGEQCKR